MENLNPKYDLEQLQHDIQNVDLSEKIDIEAEFGDQIKWRIKQIRRSNKIQRSSEILDAYGNPKNATISGDGGDVILSSMKKTLQNNCPH